MGKEAQVQASFGGALDQGRLQLELPKLIFRGAERRVFEGPALAGVRAEGDDLVLTGGERFTLGARQAASWAEAILNPPSRAKKLGIKEGQRIGLENLEDAELQPLAQPAGADALDLLFYGADSAEDLAAIPRLIPRLADNGALWIVSLKGKLLRVKDTEVMAAAKAAGLVDNKVVSFSETRTALRFTRRRG
ncbi:MAG: DUF3052 domain-containing protein [Caulobacteraceae bacterium]